jgi:hypothetical protein
MIRARVRGVTARASSSTSRYQSADDSGIPAALQPPSNSPFHLNVDQCSDAVRILSLARMHLCLFPVLPLSLSLSHTHTETDRQTQHTHTMSYTVILSPALSVTVGRAYGVGRRRGT